MSTGRSSDFKELVRSRTNLVELIGENVALKALRGGADFVGLCPFHDDHNPSFHVYPDRQTYRCWVCQEGGDCFSYVMKYEGVEFREALEHLTARAGLEMPSSRPPAGENGFVRGRQDAPAPGHWSDSGSEAPAGGGSANGDARYGEAPSGEIRKTELYAVLEWAENEFHQALTKSPQGAIAREYLSGRGFSQETVARFRLGYHPDDWEWLLNRARGRFSLTALMAAKLVNARKEGQGHYDYFVDRVIFPIRDERGRTVAFGGRVLPGREAGQSGKYFNSPESPVFLKSRLLFGLQEARDAIRKETPRTAVVVEGYADCIMCQQHGLANVVGTLGTALADSHVQALKRFADRVVLVFDGDAAGRMAAERSLGKFLAHDLDLRVLTLPDGTKDPDEFLQRNGADAFRQLIAQAVDVVAYKLNCLLPRHGLDTVGGREAILKEMLELLAESRTLAGGEREDKVLGWLSQRLVVSQVSLKQELQSLRRVSEKRSSAQGVQRSGGAQRFGGDQADREAASRKIDFLQGRRSRHDLTESELLEVLFTEPEWVEAVRCRVSVEDFQNADLRELIQVCFDLAEQGESPSFDRVLATVEDPALKQLAVLVDDMARQKGVAELLRSRPQVVESTSENASRNGLSFSCPPFLEQTIEQLTWRRHEERHQQPRLQVAQLTEATSGLDPSARALLAAIQEHHRKRAAKST